MLLADLQFLFQDAILTKEYKNLESNIIPAAGCSIKDSLAIYNNNMEQNILASMQDIYPAIEKLVGTNFFSLLVKKYIKARPSTVKNINEYGSDFAEFILEDKQAARILYLTDVAKLEWFVHLVLLKASKSQSTLKVPDNIDLENVIFNLPKNSYLLETSYPVIELRNFCINPDSEMKAEDINLTAAKYYTLVWQKDCMLQLDQLTKEEYFLLQQFSDNKKLIEVINLVLTKEPGINIIELIPTILTRGFLSYVFR